VKDRQRFALLNPLENGGDDVTPYRSIRRHKLGFLIVCVLAVDR
jgi:hypothetical protein